MAHPDYVNIEHQVNDKSVQYGVPSSYVNVGCQVVPSDYQNLVQKDGFERKSEYTDLTGNTPAVNTTIEDKSVTNSLLPQRRFNYTDILLVSKKPSDLDNDGHDQIFETDIQDALPPVVKPKPKSRAGASPDKMDFTWMRKYKVVLYYSLLSVSIIISIIAATFALIAFVRLQQDCEEFSSYCTVNETRGFCLTQPVENITTSSFKVGSVNTNQ